jgi:rhodanese-related sulfurtransferase
MKKETFITAIIASLFLLSSCASSTDTKTDVFSVNNPIKTPEEIHQILTDKTMNNLQIIDVRTPAEFYASCLPNAKNMDVKSKDFTSQIGALDKNGSYLLYCRSGVRSAEAETQMKQAGFSNIIQLKGGITAWGAAGYNLNYNCK